MYSLKGTVGNLFMHLCSILPLQDKAVFTSFEGSSFNDSPRILFEKMRKEYPDTHCVWLMEDTSRKIEGAEVAGVSSFKGLYHLATAKIWVDDCRKREWIVKRRKQFYVQTWHGGFALKKVEKDAADKLPDQYIRNAKHDSKIADAMLSGSKWCSANYRSAFWYDGEILELGLPRSDVFYQDSSEAKRKVREFYSLNEDDRLILYAPTFRVDHNTECYNIDYSRLVKAVTERFGGNWKVLVRLHPRIADLQNSIEYNDHILNGSRYSDINEQIIASDILISDYSSCMFDAMEAGRKVFLFASDIEEYSKDRGTYLSMEELPFSLAVNNDELERNILQYSEEKYAQDTQKFSATLGTCNNADSAGKILAYIYKKIQ